MVVIPNGSKIASGLRIGLTVACLAASMLIAPAARAQEDAGGPAKPAPASQRPDIETGMRSGIGGVLEGGIEGAITADTVGLRVVVSSLDPALRTADLDVVMYTRGLGPRTTTPSGARVARIGSTARGYPAIDFGDGSTIPVATLALTSTGGGPGGSNVYRSPVSFRHTYPSSTTFEARAAMPCAGCFRGSYVVFPAGSPPPGTFTAMFNFRPANIVGSLPLRLTFAGTAYNSFISNSVRYQSTSYPVVTNSAQVVFGPDIPTVSTWGLLALGLLLLGSGLALIRRSAAT